MVVQLLRDLTPPVTGLGMEHGVTRKNWLEILMIKPNISLLRFAFFWGKIIVIDTVMNSAWKEI
jgi:hypothetical protein